MEAVSWCCGRVEVVSVGCGEKFWCQNFSGPAREMASARARPRRVDAANSGETFIFASSLYTSKHHDTYCMRLGCSIYLRSYVFMLRSWPRLPIAASISFRLYSGATIPRCAHHSEFGSLQSFLMHTLQYHISSSFTSCICPSLYQVKPSVLRSSASPHQCVQHSTFEFHQLNLRHTLYS